MNNVYITLINGLGDKCLDLIGFYVICKYLGYNPNVQLNYGNKTFVWGSSKYDPELFNFNGITLINDSIVICKKILISNVIIKKYTNLYVKSPSPSASLCPYKVYEYIKTFIPEITFEEISNKFKVYIKELIKPSDIIINKIPNNIENAYGIHLRKTDKITTVKYNLTFENSIDEFDIITNKLLDNIKEICSKEENPSFFIASEDIKWKIEMINRIKKNKNASIIEVDYTNNKNYDNYESVLDMFCLSKCKVIFQGVKYSTFSIVASLLGNGKLINYSHYLDDNDKCLLHLWSSIVEINNSINLDIDFHKKKSLPISNLETNINILKPITLSSDYY
jgi:hypothetical protein